MIIKIDFKITYNIDIVLNVYFRVVLNYFLNLTVITKNRRFIQCSFEVVVCK